MEYTYFNKTGELLLKNKLSAIEYHLYDKTVPCSIDVNQTLDTYLHSTIKQPIDISIENENFKFEDSGTLSKLTISGMDKYYLKTNTCLVDIEDILFYQTELINTIKIKVIKDEKLDVDYGGNGNDTTHMDTR